MSSSVGIKPTFISKSEVLTEISSLSVTFSHLNRQPSPHAGFDKSRLFYTQGDYGLWQCSKACHNKTYDNETEVRQMLAQQRDMKIPSKLIPRCPVCDAPMTMNLRCDDTFVQDRGWYAAQSRYADFLRQHKQGKVLFLELGVGNNTPVIIKYPFWRYTMENPKATYACVNNGRAFSPKEIADRSIYIYEDIGTVLNRCMTFMPK